MLPTIFSGAFPPAGTFTTEVRNTTRRFVRIVVGADATSYVIAGWIEMGSL